MEGTVLGNTDFRFGKRQSHKFTVLDLTVLTIYIKFPQRALLVKYQAVLKSSLRCSYEKRVIVQITQ